MHVLLQGSCHNNSCARGDPYIMASDFRIGRYVKPRTSGGPEVRGQAKIDFTK